MFVPRSAAVDRMGPRRGLRELAVLAAALGLYNLMRIAAEGSPTLAAGNARHILAIERKLLLDVEAGVQDLFLDRPTWIAIWNHTYEWAYWASIVVALVWLWFRERHGYRVLRDTLFVAAALGVMIFTVFPVAPPRLMPGYVDTLMAGDLRDEADTRWTNAYAAMPSFHVGWPAVATVVLARRSRVGGLLLALVTVGLVVSVVATANHYVLDVAAGIGVSLVALAVVRRWSHDHRTDADGPEPSESPERRPTAAAGGAPR